MTGRLVFIIVFVAVASAFVLKPSSLHLVAQAKPGEYLWKPTFPVAFSESTGALRLSISPDGCEASAACEYVTAFTVDGGDTFYLAPEVKNFCGPAGMLKFGKLFCQHQKLPAEGQNKLTFSQVALEISAGGMLSNPAMTWKEVEETVAYSGWPEMLKVQSLVVGDNILEISDRTLFLRTVEMSTETGFVHAFFKSTDGFDWKYVSTIPFPKGFESTVYRIGDTKVMIMSGSPGNYTQAQSPHFGNKWEKITSSPFPVPMTSWISPYRTSIIGGAYGRPGIFAVATGSGKNSKNKNINVAEFHNRLTAKNPSAGLTNYSDEYINTTNFSCAGPEFSTSPGDGCMSSSYVSVMSFTNETVVLFYDQTFNGYGPASKDLASSVIAMKLHLNETKEQRDYEARVAEYQRKMEQERIYDEARKKAQQEAAERRAQEKRNKQLRDKERKTAFAERDKIFLEEAAKYAEEDGEFIVVRDVDSDLVDIEKELY